MNKTFWLFRIAGIQFSAKPNAMIGSLMLWILLAFLGIVMLDFQPVEAVSVGFVATCLHWVGEICHQAGHAFAARRTGWPMIGVNFWWLLGRSIYPKDEPALPPEVHIQRALGGAPASLLMAGISGLLLLWLQESQSAFYWALLFFFFENIFVFSLGALLPLGFTDGSTLLYWLPRRGKNE